MLNTLKLDDRSYDEIREETIKNIVRHCPSWTNHNASDPGIALVELFSSMTEMSLYRFNQIPDKNYMAFLEMLGINGNLVSPSASRVQFNLVENFEQQEKKKTCKYILSGTQFISKDKEVDDRPLIFETIDDRYVSNMKLKKIISKYYNTQKEKYELNTHSLQKALKPFQKNSENEESIIYIEDENFDILINENIINLIFSIDIKQSKKIDKNWFQNIKWEYSNGTMWKTLRTIETLSTLKEKYTVSSNAEHFFVTLQGDNLDLLPLIKADLSEKSAYYIRGRIDIEAYPWLKDEEIQIYEIHQEAATNIKGIQPQKILHNNNILDLNYRIYPFGDAPKEQDLFIIQDKLFSKKNQEFSLTFKGSNRSENLLKISWEYPTNSKEWSPLKLQVDTTDNLKKDGKIKFTLPSDFHSVSINGEECFAIRAKILKENFSTEKKKLEIAYYNALRNQEKNPIPPNEHQMNVPYYKNIKISYSQKKEIVSHCYIYNNGHYLREIEFNNENKDNVKKSFLSEKLENDTSLYFGFDAYLQDDYLDIFFDIQKHHISKKTTHITWEIYHNETWQQLKILHDTSYALTKSGDIRFKIDKNSKAETLFNLQGMWIRARFNNEKVHFDFPYIINHVFTNTAIVYQQETIKNEFIGQSIGLPNMKFKLNYKNLVYTPQLLIGEDTYSPIEKTKRFVDYANNANVYKFNSLTGEITFGDNEYANIPNPKEDIYAISYAISHGENGNIGKEQLILRSTIQSLDSATNIIPATGGANAEVLNDLIYRAPEVLRIKNRVITKKDYENAAADFSPYIRKAKAIAQEENFVNIFVVTKDILEQDSMKEEILLQELEEKLQEISLITVKVKVNLPTIIKININVKLVSTLEEKKISNKFKLLLEEKVRNYFDVSKNFPMGKLIISEADMYKILHKESHDYYFQSIKIWRENEIEPSESNQLTIKNEDEVIALSFFTIED